MLKKTVQETEMAFKKKITEMVCYNQKENPTPFRFLQLIVAKFLFNITETEVFALRDCSIPMDLDKILKNVSLASSMIYVQKPFKIKPGFQYWVKLRGVCTIIILWPLPNCRNVTTWEVPLISVSGKSLLQQIWFECLGHFSCSEDGLWIAPAPH